MVTADELSKRYHEWLKEEVTFSTVDNDMIRIETPFYDRHNDSIVLYVISETDNKLKLTDGGYTVDDLEAEGIFIRESEKHRNIFLNRLTSYGVQYDEHDHSLFIDSTIEKFPNDKQRLLQAILFANA